jgi:glycerol-3-phosphate dehydrogenase
VAALLAADPVAADRLLPTLPYRRGEVTRAAAAEMAVTLDDTLRRRMPVTFRDSDGALAVAADVAALMRAVLGWDGEETAHAVERYREGFERERARRALPAVDGAGTAQAPGPADERADASERRRA